MARAKTWMAMALWAALAAGLASASGCAVVNNGGQLSANGRFWSRAGRFTDRIAATKPYMNAEAYLVETNFAGAPAAPCPQPASVGTISEPKEFVYP